MGSKGGFLQVPAGPGRTGDEEVGVAGEDAVPHPHRVTLQLCHQLEIVGDVIHMRRLVR